MINRWHSWLGMPKFSEAWHEQDLQDELEEYKEETKLIKKWSELSDVVYTCTRARWSGHSLPFPLKSYLYPVGVIYMLWKYSVRFLFYRSCGRKAGANKDIRCVRNPRKLKKLDITLDEQAISVDRRELKAICKKWRRFWPLIP